MDTNDFSERLLENLRAHEVDELFLAVREVKLADPGEYLHRGARSAETRSPPGMT